MCSTGIEQTVLNKEAPFTSCKLLFPSLIPLDMSNGGKVFLLSLSASSEGDDEHVAVLCCARWGGSVCVCGGCPSTLGWSFIMAHMYMCIYIETCTYTYIYMSQWIRAYNMRRSALASPAACEHITTVKLTHLPRLADSKRSLLWLTITLYKVW